MTNEEAIDILRNAAWLGTESELAELEEAVNMACKALEFVTIKDNTDSVKVTNCNDTIYRQDAIDALQKEIDKGIPPFDDVIGSVRCGVRLARNIIEDLPSAQPEYIADDGSFSCGQENDTISRQAAIDIVVFECGRWTGLAKEISKQIKQLPPAQPERKMQCNFCNMSICTLEGRACSRKVVKE